MQRIAVFAVVVVIAAAIGFGLGRLGDENGGAVPPPPAARERPDTTIVLKMVNGTCKPGDPLALVQKTGQNVKWNITNECGEPYDVELRNFALKKSDGSLGDVEQVTDPAAPNGTIGTAGGPILARVIKNVTAAATYKYEIWLAPRGQTLQLGRDPDLEIWP